ncbi:hypothetical protein [Streptomyces sp. NBC_01207]|uniref:hypothetical protein n=1 Tax=Streptomyces sp. NBC_01207 TaxID=2903772 RepID=UPI002E0DD034|nr:hypothetical protein OG457_45595 [Streptomyces sp. NBC_01207]
MIATAEAAKGSRSQGRPAAEARAGVPLRQGRDLARAAVITRTAMTNYGTAVTQAWHRVHPRLTHRAAWLDHEGELPLVEGTLIRLEVERLSKDRAAPAVWWSSSKTCADDGTSTGARQVFL